jgi:hypothetical protein
MREVNKLVRKKDRDGLVAMGLNEAKINGLFTPDCCGRLGYADYALTNNNSKIRATKERLQLIEKRFSVESSEIEIGGVTISDNREANRLQIIFPGKPSDDCREELKRSGFRWSPREGAWQRMCGNYAIDRAKYIVSKFYAEEVQL